MGPAIGAVLSAAEGILGYAGQQATNKANAQQAREQMAFQERMSNTSYQRAMADMRAAGLNPALAYQQGGANTPSGSAAHLENPMAGLKGTAQAAAATYTNLARQAAETELTRAQTRQLNIESDARQRLLSSRATSAASGAKYSEMREYSTAMLRDAQHRLTSTNVEIADRNKWYLEATVPLRMEALRADIQRTLTSARAARASAILMELEQNRARNMSAAEQSWWKQNVTPWLGDAASVTRILSALRP